MNTPEIRQKFLEILADQLAVDPPDVTDESDLIRDLHADSLDIVEIVIECEMIWLLILLAYLWLASDITWRGNRIKDAWTFKTK